MSAFEEVPIPEGWFDTAPEPERSGPPMQCHCGRFAKYLRTRHHYNGTWTLISIDLRCSRCGEVTIECV